MRLKTITTLFAIALFSASGVEAKSLLTLSTRASSRTALTTSALRPTATRDSSPAATTDFTREAVTATRAGGSGNDASMSLTDLGRLVAIPVNPPAESDPPEEPQDPTPLIEDAIEAAVDDLNLAGISIAILRNGWTIYAGGDGYADLGYETPADENTVYSLASISKAVAGTLALRLELDGRVDLDDQTRDILSEVPFAPNNPVTGTIDDVFDFFGNPGGLDIPDTVSMPGFHTHTLRQLLAHRGCVQHYGGGMPEMTLSTAHFETEIEAADLLWDTPLRDDCTVGAKGKYSTHAFSFLGAALEVETDESLHDLLADEISEPLGLDSLGFSFDVDGMFPAPNRAVPYVLSPSNGHVLVPYEETSWKRLGGGMESTAVDLAQFGWRVLKGDVIPTAPDTNGDDCTTVEGDFLNCVLWTRQPGSKYGHGWRIGSRGSWPVASHSGLGRGFTTQLDVFRDDGLVIAIMTNTSDSDYESDFLNGESVGIDLKTLSADLADIVLN